MAQFAARASLSSAPVRRSQDSTAVRLVAFTEIILTASRKSRASFGSVPAMQGFSLVHGPHSVGRHVMKLHSTLLIEDLDLGLQFENTWIINVTR